MRLSKAARSSEKAYSNAGGEHSSSAVTFCIPVVRANREAREGKVNDRPDRDSVQDGADADRPA
jgi:hypothetical protein